MTTNQATLYVLTGGPGTGKTSTSRQLARHGYLVLPESARAVIKTARAKDPNFSPQHDIASFQLAVLRRQQNLEAALETFDVLPRDGSVFLDRSVIDGLAYCRIHKVEPPAPLVQSCEQAVITGRYAHVFLMEPRPYVQDAERQESPELARRIHEEIITVYREFGYALTHVPLLSGPAARARFILDHLRRPLPWQSPSPTSANPAGAATVPDHSFLAEARYHSVGSL